MVPVPPLVVVVPPLMCHPALRAPTASTIHYPDLQTLVFNDTVIAEPTAAARELRNAQHDDTSRPFQTASQRIRSLVARHRLVCGRDVLRPPAVIVAFLSPVSGVSGGKINC